MTDCPSVEFRRSYFAQLLPQILQLNFMLMMISRSPRLDSRQLLCKFCILPLHSSSEKPHQNSHYDKQCENSYAQADQSTAVSTDLFFIARAQRDWILGCCVFVEEPKPKGVSVVLDDCVQLEGW